MKVYSEQNKYYFSIELYMDYRGEELFKANSYWDEVLKINKHEAFNDMSIYLNNEAFIKIFDNESELDKYKKEFEEFINVLDNKLAKTEYRPYSIPQLFGDFIDCKELKEVVEEMKKKYPKYIIAQKDVKGNSVCLGGYGNHAKYKTIDNRDIEIIENGDYDGSSFHIKTSDGICAEKKHY